MLREHLAWAIAVVADQTGDVPEGVPAIITPRQVLVLERVGQRWQLIPVDGLGPVMVVRVVDDGRIGADQHQVIRRGGPGHLGEVPVADGKAPRQVPVAWNISLPVPSLWALSAARVIHAWCLWSGSSGGGFAARASRAPSAPANLPK